MKYNRAVSSFPKNTPASARLVGWLMSSSDYASIPLKDMSISQARELVFRCACILGILATVPMTYVALNQGSWLLFAANCFFLLYLFSHTYLMLTKNKCLLSPLVVLLASIAMLIGTVATGHDYLIYMAFTFAGSISLFLESRTASVASLILFIPASAQALIYLPGNHSLFFIGALALTFFIMEFLYYLLYRQENQLREQAIRDPLTNAYNRRVMMNLLENALALSIRHNTPASLLMVDIDCFKAINDNFGHAEGDTVLINLVKAFEERLRTTDKICRYGGEEFVVVLIGVEAQSAERVAESVREMIAIQPLSNKTKVTVSFGVAELSADDTLLQWLERADSALYSAKSEGRDRVCVAEKHVFEDDRE